MTDLIINITGERRIATNFDDVQAEIAGALKQYDVLITPADVPQAKADRAKLNRLVKEIDDRRKAVKADYMQPYTDLEKQIKALNKMITDCSEKIDAQIKAIEGDEKEAKRKALEAFFDDHNDTITLGFEDVFNPRWLNKTYKTEDAEAEIVAAIEKAHEDEKTVIMKLKLYITASQAETVKEFLKAQNITYEVMKK